MAPFGLAGGLRLGRGPSEERSLRGGMTSVVVVVEAVDVEVVVVVVLPDVMVE